MVTYAFYKDSYLGSAIPESAFSGVAARAEAALTKMKRIYEIRAGGEMAEKLAVCSMAEAIYQYENRKREVLQASMGEVSSKLKCPNNRAPNFTKGMTSHIGSFIS